MNCQNFEHIITDLARDILMDAATREQALAHAGDCAPCAAHLAAERTLSAGLRIFALDAAAEVAPPQQASARIESALLSAFRQHHGATKRVAATPSPESTISTTHASTDSNATTPHASPVAQASPQTTQEARSSIAAPVSIQEHVAASQQRARLRQSFSNRQSFLKFATAAAAVVIVALTTFFAARTWQADNAPTSFEQARREATADVAAPSAVTSVAETFETPNADELAAQSGGNKSVIDAAAAGLIEDSSEAEDEPRAIRQASTASWPRAVGTTTRTTNSRPHAGYSNAGMNAVAAAASDNRHARRAGQSSATGAVETEIATDFFPLAGAMTLRQTDSGHVVRVELPRSALASFGLPVNTERLGERVKADVLFGDDGIARAIRFVR
ncbi:MAG TPA: hypothetical protein VF666_21110 [Pyrinomonadaceae bacterium]|jgi:hypothetical protein